MEGYYMSIPVFEIGNTIIKIMVRCKLQGDSRSNVTDIATALYKIGVDEFEARNISRKIDEIGDKLSGSCKIILDKYGMSDERRDYVIELLLNAYNKANITIDDFLNDYSTEDLLYKRLRDTDRTYQKMLDPIEIELYESLLRHSSAFLYQSYIEMPEFQSQGIKRLNAKIDDIVRNMQVILEELESINIDITQRQQISNFENQYLRNIINRLNYVYLFGVSNMERALKRYKLSIAYVSLELLQNNGVFQLVDLIDKSQNLWIIGEAGAGKTTLLQWIAVQYAKEHSKRSIIPIYIELRNFQKQELGLRKCIESFMKDSSYDVPNGWIDNKIDSGEAILLIDGFDEIPIDSREKVFNQIEELDPERKCKKIYTSRPQITQRPCDPTLQEVTILPMKSKTIKVFLEYWHKAVLEDQLQISHEDTKKIVKKLYSKIQNSSSISKLASSPLLCAMLCALHYKNEMSLPINKRELYEECCKLLIENRDIAKGLKADINLSYEQKKIILSQLACWMMMNRYSEVDKKEANEMIKHFLSTMVFSGNDGSDHNQVFLYLLERSGILREPEKNRIDFIHRSFEEYLAATEISRQNNWGYLESMATDDMWKETVEIAIGYANSDVASRLIRAVLNKGKRKNQKYLFLACSYYNNAVQVDYKTSDDVKTNLKKLIPPKDTDIDTLVRIGDLVIDFLKMDPHDKHKPEDFINPLKILRGIGTVRALEMANSYLSFRLSPEAIKEYGLLISEYTDKELKECEVPKLIETYIYKHYFVHKTLHEAMLHALLIDEDIVLNKIESVIGSHLNIVGYTDKLDLSRLFCRNLVTSLSLYGHFESIDKLYLFPNVNNLVIYTSNNNFTPPTYSSRRIRYIHSLALILNTWSLLPDIASFLNCDNLTLIKLNKWDQIGMTIEIPSCSNLRVDGRYLSKISKYLRDSLKPRVVLLLNKELYHSVKKSLKKYNSYKGIGFEDIEEILQSYKESSGGLISNISVKQSEEELLSGLSDYLGMPENEIKWDLFRPRNKRDEKK